MKRCGECSAIYEDRLDVCPACGERLEPLSNASRTRPVESPERSTPVNARTVYNPPPPQAPRANDAYVFERQEGDSLIINGAVAESNTQQYYQSRITKILQAIFAGEPYQLSHTTFVTIFRVEEHTLRGYPEHARDITLYGNMQNLFAVGDDVTVRVRRKGTHYVARRIYNHSINGNVHIQGNIPVGVIRGLALFLIAAVVMLIYGIATADYAAIGAGIASLLISSLPTILLIALIWYVVRRFRRRRQ